VIDEVGNLELKGEGWCSAIENITKNDKIPQLWVVRKNLLPMVTKRWNTGDIYIFDIKESSTLEVKNKIIEIISQIDDQVIFDPQHFAQLPEDIR
jgi:nucleoside-triphosphatase THEP1